MPNAPAKLALALVVCALTASCESSGDETEPSGPVAREGAAPREPLPTGPDEKHGEYGLKVQFVRGQLEKDKCNKKHALELTKWLNKAGDHDGTTSFVMPMANW